MMITVGAECAGKRKAGSRRGAAGPADLLVFVSARCVAARNESGEDKEMENGDDRGRWMTDGKEHRAGIRACGAETRRTD